MKKPMRRMLIMICAAILVVSAGMVLYKLSEYKRGADTYEKASELAELPKETADTPEYDPCANIDLAALRQENADVTGWIMIPDSNISYPLVHSTQREPTFYLSHSWDAQYNTVGAIFIEPENSSELSDFNTVIYGHNMKDGSMFGTLSSYAQSDWWEGHKDIYIATDDGTKRYEVFAAYEVSTQGTTYLIGFSSDDKKQEFLDFCTAQSVVDTGVTPTLDDKVITLSTCTGRGHATRWVVQAVLRGAPS